MAKTILDGEKLLELLGMSEEDLNNPEASEEICARLVVLGKEEAEKILSRCMVYEIDTRNRKFDCNYYSDKSISTLKKEIKHCKNYLERKRLENELQIVYKNKARGFC